MNNKQFLYNEFQKQDKNIYISGKTIDLFIIYIENLKDKNYKAYLFKEYSLINQLDYKIIPLTEPFKTIYKHIRQTKFKKYCFNESNIKNIAFEVLNLYKYDKFIYRKTLKKAYQIALNSIESLIIDYEVINNQKTIINSIDNKDILKILYVNEILKE